MHKTQAGFTPRARFEEAKALLPCEPRDLHMMAWQANIICWFWQSHDANAASWMRHAIDIAAPTAMLQHALLALSLTRYGRLNLNGDAVLQGQRLYSQALSQLQKALYDPRLVWHDETLVSIRAMVLYEVYESTSDNPTAWHNHLAGMAYLMQIRGPARHRSPMAKAVFENVRYALVSG